MTTAHIAHFIREKCPWVRNWRDDVLRAWIDWFILNDLAYTTTDGEHLNGLVMARPIAAIDEHRKPYSITEDGGILFIDMCIGTSAEPLQFLAEWLRFRFGPRQHMAFQRAKHRDRVRIYDYEYILTNIEGALNGRI